MPFLVQRYQAADGTYYPDNDDFPYGNVVYDDKQLPAIRAYARRVLGSEDALQEGDVFELRELGDEEYVEITGRRLTLKTAQRDPQDV